MLNSSDWVVIRHQDEVLAGVETKLTEGQFNEWLTYRKTLRDLTEDYIPTNDFVWPETPLAF